MNRKLSDDDRKALEYLVNHGQQQTWRVAYHVGYRYEDMATVRNRNRLKRLERWGYVKSEKKWDFGPLFWEITETGRVALNA